MEGNIEKARYGGDSEARSGEVVVAVVDILMAWLKEVEVNLVVDVVFVKVVAVELIIGVDMIIILVVVVVEVVAVVEVVVVDVVLVEDASVNVVPIDSDVVIAFSLLVFVVKLVLGLDETLLKMVVVGKCSSTFVAIVGTSVGVTKYGVVLGSIDLLNLSLSLSLSIFLVKKASIFLAILCLFLLLIFCFSWIFFLVRNVPE